MLKKKEETDSLSHTRWSCKYHIVFAPKYRRQIIYGQIIRTAPLGGAARKGLAVGRPFRRALRRRQQHALIGLVHATRFTGGHDCF